MMRWILLCLTGVLALAQKPDAGGMPAPTAELERGRTVYVISSCHFCHGIDLTGAAMGAANLMTSKLVGGDENGNRIGPIVKAGLPNLQTAMPQYPDYTSQQTQDLAAYIHYLRQQGRAKQLAASNLDGGDVAVGDAYFKGSGKCAACHSAESIHAKKYAPIQVRTQLLRTDARQSREHLKLLELYSDDDVRNLAAFLRGSK